MNRFKIVKSMLMNLPVSLTMSFVALMKRFAGPDVQVKAAGGIRSWADARAMLEAGATRLGTSGGIRIIEEMNAVGLA